MMRRIALVAQRELLTWLRTPSGYVIAAMVLAIDGLLFNAFALGTGKRLSADVINDFFYFSSGTTMVAGILLAMRLFAEERQTGTMVLLRTAPLRDGEVVFAKFAAAWAFLAGITLLTLPMPLLVMVHGKISAGHLAAGYGGLLLLGGAAVAIGAVGSALADTQVFAAMTSTALLVALLLCWLLARVTEPPLADVIAHLSLFDKHFVPFMKGMVHTRDVVYYASVILFSLALAARLLRARRWS